MAQWKWKGCCCFLLNAMHCRLKKSHVLKALTSSSSDPVLSLEQFSDVIQKSQRLLSLLWAALGLILELQIGYLCTGINF